MSLRIIAGGSGQGKTRKVLEEAIRYSSENLDKNCFIVVPEQFSLEMQQKLVELHPQHGYFNIDVLSMYRLAYRVFDECGFSPKDILEDLGVSLILKKLLTEHEEDFPYFKKSIHKLGFVDELKSMLMELIGYGVSWEQLMELEDSLEAHPVLASKCRELARIFSYFEQEISDRFMVAEQIPDVLCELTPQSSMLRGSVFYFDGFTGFTPVQLHFLQELLKTAERVTVTITMEEKPDGTGKKSALQKEGDLFYFSKKTVYALSEICRQAGAEMEPGELLFSPVPPRFRNEELAFLERHLYRPRRKSYRKKVEHIHVTACRNPSMEAEYILHKIGALVRKQGYRYRDFAVLTGNVEDYASAFRRQADLLHIPLFEDTKRKVSYHSGVESLRALFHLASSDYSYESVFRYLKAGMSDFSDEETDYLENYVIAAGIRGYSMWKKPFKRRLHGLEESQVARLQTMREKLVEETGDCVAELRRKSATVREKMTALYEAMVRLDYCGKLEALADEAADRGDFVREKEYRQLFTLLMELLDKLVGIFGEESIPASELEEIMDAGLDALGLGTPPLSGDQLVLGDLKRTRLPDNKILFIAGMNEGKIPPVAEDAGIIQEEEKRILEDYGITLSLSMEERSLEDEFYMYLAFSKPEEELYFTYSSQDSGGAALRPSPLFKQCSRLFPGLKEQSYPGEEIRYYFNGEDSRELLMEGLKKIKEGEELSAPLRSLLQFWAMKEESRRELFAMWEGLDGPGGRKRLSQALSQALYGPELRGSVTRLERFAACPYQYYCTYGLELRERESYTVRPVDLGNLFHRALELFSGKIKESEYTWKTLPEYLAEEWIEEVLRYSEEESVREVMESSARNRYKRKVVERILKRTIKILQIHLENSQMEPDSFELKFGGIKEYNAGTIPLSRGNQMKLAGSIDRVDICEEEDRLYLRIIDYKSGSRSFDLNDLYYGLQMQLIVYMEVATEYYEKTKNKEVVPAGMYYYYVKDPLIKTDEPEEEALIKNFRMSGYSNSEPEVLNRLEMADGAFVSASVRLKKTGEAYKNSQVMSEDDFHRAGTYMRKKMVQMGEALYDGAIAAAPYQNEKGSACDYCPYASVCGFDAHLDGYHYRKFEHLSPEEVLEQIREEVE